MGHEYGTGCLLNATCGCRCRQKFNGLDLAQNIGSDLGQVRWQAVASLGILERAGRLVRITLVVVSLLVCSPMETRMRTGTAPSLLPASMESRPLQVLRPWRTCPMKFRRIAMRLSKHCSVCTKGRASCPNHFATCTWSETAGVTTPRRQIAPPARQVWQV